MAPPPRRAALAFLVVAAMLLVAAAAAAPHHELDPARWATDEGRGAVMPVSACTAEDLQEEGCEGGEATTTRRQLGGNNYIGYDALRRNAVPCSYRGASYYNCRPGAPANPYSRGCSSITRCRG